MPQIPLIFIFVLALFSSNASAQSADQQTNVTKKNSIVIEDSWIRQAPPNIKVLAAYMTITNLSDKTINITTITSAAFEKIEMHRTFHKEGVAHMEHLPTLAIPALQKIAFEPGGIHLMLFNPSQKITTGESIILQLSLSNNQTIQTTAIVQKRQKVKNDSHSHQHH